MEVLQEKVAFCRKDQGPGVKWQCKLLLVDFQKLLSGSTDAVNDEATGGASFCEHSVQDLLHAVAGVCSLSLPDMEVPAIYSTLTSQTCKTAVIITSKKNVISCRELVGCSRTISPSIRALSKEENTVRGRGGAEVVSRGGENTDGVGEEGVEDVNPFEGIISDEESVNEGEEEAGESVDLFAKERQAFLDEAMHRKTMADQLCPSSVGAEHCVLGCAAFSRISGSGNSQIKPIQLSLLAVRKRCRKIGIGRHLMQSCKDPEVVGHYNVLLTFADHNAEDFFSRHGFSEDPILAACYESIVEPWDNSTLMVYIPPFSEAGLAVGSLKSLTHFQEYYKQWRENAIAGYSTQLGVMERLRHELLLLHSKVQSQDECIEVLSKELKQMKESKKLLEEEFQHYRKRSQILCAAAREGAQEWINSNQ